MNIEQEIMVSIINLIEDIKNNNLENAKTQVDFLNQNFSQTEDFGTLNDFIPFFDLSNLYNNETLEYAVNNLNNIYNNKKIKWNILVRNLIKTQDKQQINNFLNEYSEEENLLNYQYTSLIQLAAIVDNWNILTKLREKISI